MLTKKFILKKLKETEEKEQVKILYTAESGSRGWDIRKALKLFKNSNPPLYEWLSSSIVYLEKGNFAQKLRGLIPKFYSPLSCLHHYLSMAKGNYKAYLANEKVKMKKYFYILRPIFACMWIEKQVLTPPMEFEKLFRAQKLNPELTSKVQQLLERKRSGEESNMEDKIEILNDFLEEKIKYFEDYTKKFKTERPKADDSFLSGGSATERTVEVLGVEDLRAQTEGVGLCEERSNIDK